MMKQVFFTVFFTVFFALFAHVLLAQQLILSEYGPTNGFEDRPEWFEIQNTGEVALPLNELELYLNENQIYVGPDSMIGAGAFFVFLVDDFRPTRKPLLAHRSMFSPNRGAYILNFNDASSSLKAQCVPDGMSYGLNAFGNEVHFRLPSMGGMNEGEEVLFLPNEPKPSLPSGFYPNPINLTFEQEVWEGQKTIYSLAGGSLQPTGAVISSNGISVGTHPVNADLSYIPASGEHIAPNGTVETAQTLQVQAFQYTCAVSDVRREVYFIGEAISNKYKLPVISISTQDDALFGPKGIYGFGDSGYNFDFKGELWEREASVHFFDEGELKLSQNVGVRIRGKSSRWAPQKSFKVYARSEYGRSHLPNVFFEDEVDFLKRINLRSAHNDYIRSMMTDHVAMTAAKGLDFESPNSRHAVLFLNGEFWGIYAIQDSMDEHYPDTYFGLDDDDVSFVDGSESLPLNYTAIINYALEHATMTDEDVAWIEERVDLHSLLEYHAYQIYLANWDWPQKNVKAWLSEEDRERLRFFFFDCDACFNEFNNESLARFYPELNTARHSILLSALLKNDQVRERFAHVLQSLSDEALSSSNLLEIIDVTENNLRYHIDEHIARWGYPQHRSGWENSVESMRSFVLKRPAQVSQMLNVLLGNELMVFPNPIGANGELNLFSFGILEDAFDYEIIDFSGRSLQKGSSNLEFIQLRNIIPGNYLVRVNKGSFMAYARFVVIP